MSRRRTPATQPLTAPLHYPEQDLPQAQQPMQRSCTTGRLRLPPSRRRRNQRVKGFFRLLMTATLGLGLTAVTAAGGAFGYAMAQGKAPVTAAGLLDLAKGLEPLTHRQNILLLGTDFSYTEGKRMAEGPVRSDTMMVASVDPATKKLTVISIPRDTRVLIKGRYEKQTSPYYAAARLWVDDIIDPRDTRKVIAEGLHAANHNAEISALRTGVFQV